MANSLGNVTEHDYSQLQNTERERESKHVTKQVNK